MHILCKPIPPILRLPRLSKFPLQQAKEAIRYPITTIINNILTLSKKISYTNPYSFRKTFLLRTNRPELVQFKDPKLEVNPKERVFFSVRFLPNSYVHGRTEILLFINDAEYDKNEECIALAVEYLEDE